MGNVVNIYDNNGRSIKKVRQNPVYQETGGTGRHSSQRFDLKLSTDEYLSALQFPNDIPIYEKMSRSDTQVKAVLLMLSLPIRSTQWFIKAKNKSKKAMKIADYIENCLFGVQNEGLQLGYDDLIRNITTMFTFGHSIFEKVFEVKKGFIKWKKFAVRPQSTIYDIYYDKVGDVQGIKQYLIDQTMHYYYIPIEKLLIFSNDMQQGNIRGTSVLRSAYKHWYIKDFLYKIVNIGVERNLVGTPVITLPENYTQEDKDFADEIVTALRSHELGGARLPAGFTLSMFEGKRSLIDVLPYIKYQDDQISKSALAQFMNLGSSGSGSFALSSDLTKLFLMMLDSSAKNIANIVNSHAIPELVRYNFDSDLYPQLCFKPMDSTKIVNTLKTLVDGKIVLPDNDLEDYIRDMLGIPDKEKSREDYEIKESKKITEAIENKNQIETTGTKEIDKIKESVKQKDSKIPIETNSKKKTYSDKQRDDRVNLCEFDLYKYNDLEQLKSNIEQIIQNNKDNCNEVHDILKSSVIKMCELVENKELHKISTIKSQGHKDLKNYINNLMNYDSVTYDSINLKLSEYEFNILNSIVNIVTNEICEKLKSTFLNEYFYNYTSTDSRELNESFESYVIDEFRIY